MKQVLPKNLVKDFIKKHNSTDLFTFYAGKLKFPNISVDRKDYSFDFVVEIPIDKVDFIEPVV